METKQSLITTALKRYARLVEVENLKAVRASKARDHFLLQGLTAEAEVQQVAVETATATAARFQALADRLVHLTK